MAARLPLLQGRGGAGRPARRGHRAPEPVSDARAGEVGAADGGAGRGERALRAGRPPPLATGIARPWGTRHARLSPRYTTRLDELMEARAW
ncbi:DUF4113 domain-containing protein [Craurococcus roseus]|uniref:DUF4113 domain-containing protein n=1 Tax=Craurococcus roseus TaxID=77585 RepID=UPI0038D123AF